MLFHGRLYLDLVCSRRLRASSFAIAANFFGINCLDPQVVAFYDAAIMSPVRMGTFTDQFHLAVEQRVTFVFRPTQMTATDLAGKRTVRVCACTWTPMR